ncbi:MAG: AmmeMemoRadiSam system protein A [Armatimonadota bacterium]|jgi:AmmeMemoRadiSam system protein A
MLTQEQQDVLLRLARESLRAWVCGEPTPKPDITDPALQEKLGAFVTLTKHGSLRGCIGLIEASRPVYQAVMDMARSAALEDPRFPPVEPPELDDIRIEISAIGPLEAISDPVEIQVGTHGLMIRKGFHSGLLLPQVASERNWSRSQFLEQTCLKAGLAPNEWKQNAEMSVFTAQVFGDKHAR